MNGAQSIKTTFQVNQLTHRDTALNSLTKDRRGVGRTFVKICVGQTFSEIRIFSVGVSQSHGFSSQAIDQKASLKPPQ